MEGQLRVQIRVGEVKLTKAQRAAVEHRLDFALARFGDRIARVSLRFSEASRYDGSGEKRCQIVVGMRPRSLRVDHADSDLLVALDYAAHRVARSVARAVERESWEEAGWRR
jgi:ribosome-associated translation inhibitor RaiA